MKCKRFMSTLAITLLILLGTNSIFAYASTEDQSEYATNDVVSEAFMNFFPNFYTEPDKYTICDSNNQDITEVFFNSTKHFFIENDFVGLKKYVIANKITGEKIVEENGPQTRATRSNTVAKDFYEEINTGKVTGDMLYRVSGQYTWDINSGQITQYSNSKLTIRHLYLGEMWDEEIKILSDRATLSSGKGSVTFRVQFNLKVTANYDIIPADVYDCGTFSGSVVGSTY